MERESDTPFPPRVLFAIFARKVDTLVLMTLNVSEMYPDLSPKYILPLALKNRDRSFEFHAVLSAQRQAFANLCQRHLERDARRESV